MPHSMIHQLRLCTSLLCNMDADQSEDNFAPPNGIAYECPPVIQCYIYEHK
jgi:hypothetical protein